MDAKLRKSLEEAAERIRSPVEPCSGYFEHDFPQDALLLAKSLELVYAACADDLAEVFSRLIAAEAQRDALLQELDAIKRQQP